MKSLPTRFVIPFIITALVAVVLHLATGLAEGWIIVVAAFAGALLRALLGDERPRTPRTQASKNPDAYRWGHGER
jgi:hypothetical protein